MRRLLPLLLLLLALPVYGQVQVETGIPGVKADGEGRMQVVLPPGGSGLTDAELRASPVIVGDGAGALNVICDSGCGGAASFEDGDAFVGGTTPVNVIGGVYDTTPPAIADGSAGGVRMNVNRALHVDGSAVTQPVSGPVTDAQLRATPVPVSGTVTITDGAGAVNVIVDSSALPTGAATAANQDGIVKDGAGDTTQANVSNGRLHTDGSGVTQPVSGPVTDAQLRATPVPVSGTVTITDGAGAVNVICDSGCGGAASFEDNDPFVADTTPVNVMGALYDTTPPAITDGNAGSVRMNSNRQLLVDGSAVTQPVSAASLPLPTGAATSANQDGIVKDGAGDTTQANVSGGRLHVDGSGVTQPVSGTVTVGTFPDNEPFNQAQIAGTATAVNTGTASAGTQRVVLASDQPAVTVRAGNSNAIISCDANAKLNMTTATTTEIVALSGSTRIYVCSYSIMTSAAANVKFVDGTGTNCGTSQSDVSSNMHFLSTMPGIARGSGQGMLLKTSTDGDALCVTSSAAVNVDVDISYTRF